MKQFVVIGLGSFGFNLALNLTKYNNQVIAIDQDADKVQAIKDQVTLAAQADVKDKHSLKKLLDKNIDIAIISLGEQMESSILTTLALKEIGIDQIYVKAISRDHGKILKLIGATDVIFPEKEIAIKLAANLSNPNILDYLPFAKGYSIVELVAPDVFIDKTLIELKLRNKFNIEVIAIKKVDTDEINMIPGANYQIVGGDALIVAGRDSDIKGIQELQ